jgi:hypothetical protein
MSKHVLLSLLLVCVLCVLYVQSAPPKKQQLKYKKESSKKESSKKMPMPQPSKKKPPSRKKQVYDEEEHMYFENLRKKLKNYETEENDKIKKRKKKDPKPVKEEATDKTDKTDKEEPKKEEPVKDEGVSFSAQTSMLVLEAMEELVRNVRESSTKGDMDDIIKTVDEVATKQEASQLILENVKRDLETDVKSLTNEIILETSQLKKEISRLDTVLNTINVQVGDLKTKHDKQGRGLHTLTGDVRLAIASESSSSHKLLWGLMIVQMILAAAFVIYKQYTDNKTKKLHSAFSY